LSNLKRFFQDTLIYGIAAVLPRAINILLVKLHTNTLSSEKYAENTLYFVYAAYLNAILTFGMETAFFRFFTKEKEKGKVISTTFYSIVSVTLFFLALSLYFSVELSNYFGFGHPIYLQILICVTALDTLVVVPFAYLRVTNKPIKFASVKILNILIYAFFNVLFLVFLPKWIDRYDSFTLLEEIYQKYPLVIFIFLSNLIASIVTFLVLFPIIFKFKFSFDKNLFRKMLAYGIPILITSLAFVTNENLDKILIEKYLGKEEMGIYAACYKLGVFMMLFTMAFRLGAEPFFFNKAADKNAKETYAKILNWFTILGSLFLVIVLLFLPLFAQLLLGDDSYYAGLKIVPIILYANLILGISYNLAVWYKLTDKTIYGTYFALVASAITILFNVLLIPKIGYMASAWATLLSYSSIAVLSYITGQKNYPIPYSIAKTMFYLFASAIISVISLTKFNGNYGISVLLLVLFIALILWKEKSELQNIFKK
jgi:O-antigen/teichoic acid export membrane protein